MANPQLSSGGWQNPPELFCESQQFNNSTVQQSTIKQMTKTCPRCGKTFECVHSVDCWCVKVKLTDTTKAYLKANYSDCLCKECLEEINGK
jgi:membrane protease subunit (stomatin/prohibitin family)